ncbi:CoA transferase [Caenimonas terrae]|uniref:CoA transferase n=1 Tax=Caenimonas terrae TaxID=696074 RepID=A0ABW0NC86_9BURK
MPSQLRVLQGFRVLSLALNLPGPAALMRCRRMGATCAKLEPPAGDPMGHYNPTAYAQLHEGVRVVQADLKSAAGQAILHRELARTDVLLTSFRPSALAKLGLGWKDLHTRYPQLSQVAIVGAAGARAEEPGHDLTYLADNGLVGGLELPATLYADMSGSLLASEAVLQAALVRNERYGGSGENHPQGALFEVALADAAHYLSLPRQWGLTTADGAVGGAHAGYAVYPCSDGRVAVAALEPHFAAALCRVAGVAAPDPAMRSPATRAAIASYFAGRTRDEIERVAREHDLPLHCMA